MEKEVPRTPKGLAGLDGSYGQQVAQPSPQIEKQEGGTRYFLPNRILGQPKQNELTHIMIHLHDFMNEKGVSVKWFNRTNKGIKSW